MSTPEAIDLEYYEQQSKQRLARHFEEDDRINEHHRRERERMIAESVAGLLELRRQVEEERARYEEERWREFKIERLQRITRAVDKEAYEAHNAARVETAESDRAQAEILGLASPVATPPSSYAGSPRQSQYASPSRQANLRPATNPEGEFTGYDRMEDLGVDSCSPPQ